MPHALPVLQVSHEAEAAAGGWSCPPALVGFGGRGGLAGAAAERLEAAGAAADEALLSQGPDAAAAALATVLEH